MVKLKSKKFMRAKIRDMLFVYFILLWPVVHFCIFSIGMNVSMAVSAFQDPSGRFYGFENFKSVLTTFSGLSASSTLENPRAILNSLSILPLSLLVDMPISLLFSYVIYKKYCASKFFSVVLFIPTVISAVVLCLCFKMAISRDFGFVPQLLEGMGLSGAIPANGFLGDPSTSWWFILLFSIWTGISTNMIYFSSAISRISESVIESARIDGASDLRQFFVMIIPMIWGTITTVSITCISNVFGWYLPSLLLTNGTAGTSTIGLIVIINSQARTNLNFVSAFGVLIAIVGSFVTFGSKKLMERFWRDVEY